MSSVTKPWLVLKFGGTSVSGLQQWEAIASLAEPPLLMLSQSANDLCISLLLRSSDAEELLKILHMALIGKGLDAAHKTEVFGPAWQEIQQ